MAQNPLAGVNAKTPFITFLRLLVRSRLDEMMVHYDGTLAGNAEALHDMRVASRRLRSALLLGRGLFSARRRFRRLERRIARFTEVLGRVRDLDVLELALANERRKVAPGDEPHLDRLAAHVDGRRAERREAMNEALMALGRPEKLLGFTSFFDDPPIAGR
jgi:CHAD domain-containing protein